MNRIADRIRTLMDQRGFSVASLAEAAAISRMTLTRRLTDPAGLTLSEIEAVAKALGTEPLYLVTGDAA